MRFQLIDRIEAVEPGRSIRATKNLTLGEEYLADHFPTFPVMPGVLMLQTLVEAGAGLVRFIEDFRERMVVLKEARNCKFGTFMDPGRQMLVTVEYVEENGDTVTLKGKGEVEGNATVSARLSLARYNLRDRKPALQATDEHIVQQLRSRC